VPANEPLLFCSTAPVVGRELFAGVIAPGRQVTQQLTFVRNSRCPGMADGKLRARSATVSCRAGNDIQFQYAQSVFSFPGLPHLISREEAACPCARLVGPHRRIDKTHASDPIHDARNLGSRMGPRCGFRSGADQFSRVAVDIREGFEDPFRCPLSHACCTRRSLAVDEKRAKVGEVHFVRRPWLTAGLHCLFCPLAGARLPTLARRICRNASRQF